jgi:hypothetical protein
MEYSKKGLLELFQGKDWEEKGSEAHPSFSLQFLHQGFIKDLIGDLPEFRHLPASSSHSVKDVNFFDTITYTRRKTKGGAHFYFMAH